MSWPNERRTSRAASSRRSTTRRSGSPTWIATERSCSPTTTCACCSGGRRAYSPASRRFSRSSTDRWLEIWLTKGPSEGSDAPYYIAVVSDITAAKAAQAAMLQLNDIKSQFIATMGREIRAPLHEIVGVSELFKRTAPLTEKQRRFAETIDASAQTLVHLVDDILEFSKIEAAKLQ